MSSLEIALSVLCGVFGGFLLMYLNFAVKLKRDVIVLNDKLVAYQLTHANNKNIIEKQTETEDAYEGLFENQKCRINDLKKALKTYQANDLLVMDRKIKSLLVDHEADDPQVEQLVEARYNLKKFMEG